MVSAFFGPPIMVSALKNHNRSTSSCLTLFACHSSLSLPLLAWLLCLFANDSSVCSVFGLFNQSK